MIPAVGFVFPSLPDWARREIPKARNAWAPDIAFFDGRYHLYYSVSSFGSRDSAIGLATTRTLDPSSPDYRWVDEGMVLRSCADKDDWNAGSGTCSCRSTAAAVDLPAPTTSWSADPATSSGRTSTRTAAP